MAIYLTFSPSPNPQGEVLSWRYPSMRGMLKAQITFGNRYCLDICEQKRSGQHRTLMKYEVEGPKPVNLTGEKYSSER